jgi:hypothetical protein
MIAQVSTPKCGETSTFRSAPGGTLLRPPAAANNVLSISVNGGPTNNSLNQPFASVTICVPGTSNCQIIGGLLVYTDGRPSHSRERREPAAPQQTGSDGAPVASCLTFVDGSVIWGSGAPDIRRSRRQANSVPIR